MTDKEKIILFENYLREKGYEEEKIKYNILVVKLLVQEVLYYFEENLENIDTYTFEEFTDMIRLIDDELGGRNGIAKILDCMLELTEFLKINKMIKGGKIAHYKRMFSNIDYYLDKYDMMTGRKDDTKEFLKRVTDNKFSHNVIKLIEDVNVYEFKTMEYIDKILSDIPFSKKEYNDDINLLKRVLISLNLIDEKNGQIDVTKKGRTVSRLPVDEKYAAILFLLIFDTNWNKVIFDTFNMPENAFDYSEVIHLISTIFINKNDIIIDLNSIKDIKEDETLVEISRERFRLAKMEVTPYVDNIINICLIGMGILDVIPQNGGVVNYHISDFGMEILRYVFNEYAWRIKNHISNIEQLIRNKNFQLAERSMIKFLINYGDNVVVWNYFGQLLILKRDFKNAYVVLKHAYELTSKRGKISKSILYHLVLCCRKLRYEDDINCYEEKLKKMERI